MKIVYKKELRSEINIKRIRNLVNGIKKYSSYSIITGNKSQKIRDRWTEEEIKEHQSILSK